MSAQMPPFETCFASPSGVLFITLENLTPLVSSASWPQVDLIARQHGKPSANKSGRTDQWVSISPNAILFLSSSEDTQHMAASTWHDIHKILPQAKRPIAVSDMEFMGHRIQEGSALCASIGRALVSMDILNAKGKSRTSMMLKWEELAGIAKSKSKGFPFSLPPHAEAPKYGILDIHPGFIHVGAYTRDRAYGHTMTWEEAYEWIHKDGESYFIDDKKDVLDELLNSSLSSMSRKFSKDFPLQ
jgi:hypothetical protein